MANSAAKKLKGPIRTEAVLPIAIIFGGTALYFALFFDGHLRHLLEFVGTKAVGAEVNISSLHTSFLNASLDIRRIQLTDAEKPATNKLEIGEIRWKMLWDALLRGKVVIQDASVLGIALGTPRERPGRVLPPPPPSTGDSAVTKLSHAALDKASKQFSGNALGDVAQLLSGADPIAQLKNLGDQLKSSARIKELEAELGKKKEEWNQRLAQLPKTEDIKNLEARLKSVKVDGFTSPQEVQQSLSQVEALVTEVNTKANQTKETGLLLGREIGEWEKTIGTLKGTVEQDIQDLKSRLKIPSIDGKSLAKNLFGPMVLSKLQTAQTYYAKAQKYMPPPKSAEEKEQYAPPRPHPREKGVDYEFGKPRSYPAFWLVKSAISSKASPGGLSGDVEGTLRNVASNPSAIADPLTLEFKGDFPAQKLSGVRGLLTVDYRTSLAKQSIDLSVASFAVTDLGMVDSPDVKLGIKSAVGSARAHGEVNSDSVKLALQTSYNDVGYDVHANQPLLSEILGNILKEVRKVSVDAEIGGPWSDLNIGVKSNLADALEKGFAKELSARIAQAQAKIRELIEGRIAAEKEKLLGQFGDAKGSTLNGVKDRETAINAVKQDVEGRKNKLIAEQKSKVEQGLKKEGQKAVDDLKKQLGF